MSSGALQRTNPESRPGILFAHLTLRLATRELPQKGLPSMNHKLSHLLFVLVCGLCVSQLTYAQKVSTTLDDKYSFSDHKRYAWRENRLTTRQNPDTNEVMDLKIVKNVNQLLAARGFVEVKERPDFYVYYDGGGDVN